jgi:hypothetical protein
VRPPGIYAHGPRCTCRWCVDGRHAPACPPGAHDALKADAARWAALPLLGVQHTEADDEGPAEDTELRDCPDCRSTLGVVRAGAASVRPPLTTEQLVLESALRRAS